MIENLNKAQVICKALSAIYIDKDVKHLKDFNVKPGLYAPIQKHLLKPYQLEKSFIVDIDIENQESPLYILKDLTAHNWVYNDETYLGDIPPEKLKKIDNRYIFNLINIVRNDEHCDCSIGKTVLNINKNEVELYKTTGKNKPKPFYIIRHTSEILPFMEDVIIECVYEYAKTIYAHIFENEKEGI